MNRDLSTYITCILTTYVCQQPPDYESALELVMQVKSSQPDLVDDAIKYMIFLSDTNKLYDVALGLYDFQLVLLVAQQSQKVRADVQHFRLGLIGPNTGPQGVPAILARDQAAARRAHAAL
jgi:hypothetical protein